MKKRLSTIETEPYVTSTLYYPKDELEKFIYLFSSVDIIDENLKVYVEILNDILSSKGFDNLPKDPEERKKKIINLVKVRINAINNAVLRDKVSSWFNKSCTLELDLELNEELLYRYCWSEFMDRIALEDSRNTSFKDKLTIKPVVPAVHEKAVKSLSEIEIKDEDQNQTIYKTGITAVDNMVTMKKTNFVVIAARTTIGKSLFMINQAVYNASKGINVLYVSLEESDIELKKRVNLHIKNNSVSEKKKVEEHFLVYTPNTNSPDSVLNEITKITEEHNVGIVFLDYIQLMKYPQMSDFESLRALTRNLKLFAVSRKILLITASQLKRETEYTGSSLTGLWGSSTLEADANAILILEPTRKQNTRINNTSSVSIIVAKNRNGEQGKIENITIDYAIGHIIE